MNIKRLATKFKKEVGENYSRESLTLYLDKAGFDIIYYDTTDADSLRILAKMNSVGIAKQRTSFTYYDNSRRVVFVDKRLDKNALKTALIKEIGHHLCKHRAVDNYVGNTTEMMAEASEFSLAVLRPTQKMVKPEYVVIALLIVVCIAGFSLFAVSQGNKGHDLKGSSPSPLPAATSTSTVLPTESADPEESAAPDPESDETKVGQTVYLAKTSRDVYHTFRDCSYIKDKPDKDIKKTSVNDAESDGRRLCSRCLTRQSK